MRICKTFFAIFGQMGKKLDSICTAHLLKLFCSTRITLQSNCILLHLIRKYMYINCVRRSCWLALPVFRRQIRKIKLKFVSKQIQVGTDDNYPLIDIICWLCRSSLNRENDENLMMGASSRRLHSCAFFKNALMKKAQLIILVSIIVELFPCSFNLRLFKLSKKSKSYAGENSMK